MNSKAFIAGIACLASAAMAEARGETEAVEQSQAAADRKTLVVKQPAKPVSDQQSKMDLLVNVLRTRLN